MADHPTADRSFYDKMLAAHTRNYGKPDAAERAYIWRAAGDLVKDLGLGVEFATANKRGPTSAWNRARYTASQAAKSVGVRVIRRFDTASEDDD